MQTQMKMLMKTEWKIKMQIKIKIKTKNTKQNVNDDRKTQMQMQIEIKVAEPPRIPYLTNQLADIFACILSKRINESDNFSDSSFITFSNPNILGFLFLRKIA